MCYSTMTARTCLLLVMFIVGISSDFILPEYDHCNAPLGMESGSIADSDLTSSSTHDISSVGPQMARIRTELEGGAWCPEKPIGLKSYEYLEIELRQLFFINAIETQGRFGNGQGREFAETYQIQYQRTEQKSAHWFTYRSKTTNRTILNGNVNTYMAEKRPLTSAILAKRIRIVPYSTRRRTICIRVELYGCPFYGGVVAYTAPPSIELDRSYDGEIGKLTDGIIGSNDDDSWLGWNRSPVSIQFRFDTLRHFKIIRIYSIKTKYRSIEIKFDDGLPIQHHLSPISSSSSSSDLSTIVLDTIQLINYGITFLATRIEMTFVFDDNLLLTEITFDNEPATVLSTTSMITNATNCPLACLVTMNNNLTFGSTTFASSAFTFEWLTILIGALLSLCFILLLILALLRLRQRRHRRLRNRSRQNSSLYYKSSQMTATTSGSCVSSSSSSSAHGGSTLPVKNNHLLAMMMTTSNAYDDVTSEQQSMGSYIYPITSTTSLLHPTTTNTNSPSSLTPPLPINKGEQYAVIDGNYSLNPYVHWPKMDMINNTFHYASSDITANNVKSVEKISRNPRISLFGCIALQKTVNSKYNPMISPPSPPRVDESKLFALRKIVESMRGEIYIGKYTSSTEIDSKCVLIKIVKTNAINTSRQVFLNELDVLSSLHHHNLVRICAVQLDLLYFVQEHSDFGTLQDYSRTLSQTNDLTIQKLNICFAYQLASALQHLADLAIVHGDVAARNCLFFSDYTIKLTDCAMALPQYAHEYWSCPNSGQQIPLRWLAPEALTTCPTNKSDVYSFAVTLWELWSRCSSLPHESLTHEELYQRILMQQSSCHHHDDDFTFALSVPPDCPKEIYDLLCECWHSDGLKRPTIGDIALYFRRHVDACRLVPI